MLVEERSTSTREQAVGWCESWIGVAALSILLLMFFAVAKPNGILAAPWLIAFAVCASRHLIETSFLMNKHNSARKSGSRSRRQKRHRMSRRVLASPVRMANDEAG